MDRSDHAKHWQQRGGRGPSAVSPAVLTGTRVVRPGGERGGSPESYTQTYHTHPQPHPQVFTKRNENTRLHKDPLVSGTVLTTRKEKQSKRPAPGERMNRRRCVLTVKPPSAVHRNAVGL